MAWHETSTIYTLIKGSRLHEGILIVPHLLIDEAPPIVYSTFFIVNNMLNNISSLLYIAPPILELSVSINGTTKGRNGFLPVNQNINFTVSHPINKVCSTCTYIHTYTCYVVER